MDEIEDGVVEFLVLLPPQEFQWLVASSSGSRLF